MRRAIGDGVELVADGVWIRLGEDGVSGRGDHLGGVLGEHAEDIAKEMNPAVLGDVGGDHHGPRGDLVGNPYLQVASR